MELNNECSITIIIPLYNQRDYIVECLNAFLNPVNVRIQIIIIDDYSKDDSIEVTEEWFTKNKIEHLEVKFIKNEENIGICRTLNKGLSLAKYEIIALCAADDILCLQNLIAKITKLSTTDYDAIISDVVIINESSVVTMNSGFKELFSANLYALSKESFLAGEIITNWSIPGPSLMIKKDVYNRIGNYNETLIAEDRDFYLRLLHSCKVLFDSEPTAFYRVHSTNISNNSNFRIKMNEEIRMTNIRHANKWRGINRWYLASYKFGRGRNSLTQKLAMFFGRLVRLVLRFLFISKVYLCHGK